MRLQMVSDISLKKVRVGFPGKIIEVLSTFMVVYFVVQKYKTVIRIMCRERQMEDF